MSRDELLKRLFELNIPASIYSFDGKWISGVVFEKFDDKRWRVYECGDRGECSNDLMFLSEERAYDYMYALLEKRAIFFRPENRS